MISHILTPLLFYFILMYFSVNLLGFLVRGLFSNPEIDKLEKEGTDFVKKQIKKNKKVDNLININAIILIVIYFYLLFHFWNIGIVIVSLMFMISRFPDLLWEIKNGRKIDKSTPKNIWFYISPILNIVAFLILYYSLYYL